MFGKVMDLLRTRHSLGFDPVTDKLDPAGSPYADWIRDYPQKRRKLACLVGTELFLWCLPAAREFPRFEEIKPVEWVIKVHANRILGFVDDERWKEYLEGTRSLHRGVFSTVGPPAHEHEYSVLVKLPLRQEELVSKAVFKIASPDKAEILSREKFNES